MSEVSLRTRELYNKKEKYIAWKPIGSVVSVINYRRMRLKWIEIICDLARPEKRASYEGFPGWTYICQHWSRDKWEAWREEDVGKTLIKNMDTFWKTYCEESLISALGKDPRGQKNLTDTWLWSEHERKIFFIVVNEDEVDEVKVDNWQGVAEQFQNGDLFITKKTRVKFQTDIPSISDKTQDDIMNPDIVIHPKFDSPISKTLVSMPDLAELK